MMYTITAERVYPWREYCGIPGGIPARPTIYTTLNSGATTSQLNAAIQACPADQTIRIAAGTYSFGSLTFDGKSGVTIRGDGPGVTVINMTGAISGTGYDYSEGDGIAISSGATKGSMSIVLATSPTARFVIGNIICIAEDRDENKWGTGVGIYTRVGFPTGSTVYGLNQNRCFRFMVRITGVNGNTISLAAPIPLSFTATNIKAYPPGGSSRPSMCGIENMTLNAQNNVDTPVRFYSADRCWTKDIELKNVPGSDIGMIKFHQSAQCEINRCYIHDATGWPSQADGYASAFNFGASNCLIINTITYRVADLCETNGAAGCAYINNHGYRHNRASSYARGITLDHGPHGFMNLAEGNILANVCNDGYHGSTSHCVMFRNHLNAENMAQRKVVNLCRGAYYNTLVGNVLGNSSYNPTYYEAPLNPSTDSAIYFLGFPTADSTGLGGFTSVPWTNWAKSTSALDPDVKATLLRHANYDYYNDAVVWDDADHDIPDSLFYDSKPEYFGALSWPAIGPDVSGYVAQTPAKARWDAYTISGSLADLFADQPAGEPTYTIGIVPTSQAVRQGDEADYEVTINAEGGFSDDVTLGVDGLPVGTTPTFDENPLGPDGTTTLRIPTTGLDLGTHNLKVTGTT